MWSCTMHTLSSYGVEQQYCGKPRHTISWLQETRQQMATSDDKAGTSTRSHHWPSWTWLHKKMSKQLMPVPQKWAVLHRPLCCNLLHGEFCLVHEWFFTWTSKSYHPCLHVDSHWISAIYCLQASSISISDEFGQGSAKWIDPNCMHCLSASVSRFINHKPIIDSYN